MPYLVFLALTLLAVGCQDIRHTSSGVLTEKAVVVNKLWTPSRHDTTVVPTVDYDGNVGLAIDTTDVPEKWGVIFKCQHGEFMIYGSKTRHCDLWNRMKEERTVTVKYVEHYEELWEEDPNDSEKKKLKSRKLIDFDFVDAELCPVAEVAEFP